MDREHYNIKAERLNSDLFPSTVVTMPGKKDLGNFV